MSDRLREAAQAALEALLAGPHANLLMNVGGIIEKLNAALAEQEAEPVVYRATSAGGDTAHFGVASAARAWARGGTLEAVPLKHLRLVPKYSECGPDCRQCGMLCKKGFDIDQRFAGRLAIALECMTFDPTRFWQSSCDLLDEYKREWERINPQPPTFMGEVIPERRERLLKLKADRAEIAQKSRRNRKKITATTTVRTGQIVTGST